VRAKRPLPGAFRPPSLRRPSSDARRPTNPGSTSREDRLASAVQWPNVDRIMYVELKSGNDRGPAWIGRVRTSKTGRTVYYRGKTLRRQQGVAGNHVDVDSGEEFWVSGIKKDGTDRHWAGSGPVEIDPDVFDEYLAMVEPKVKARILGMRG
jgi:hypothetical protein